MPAPPLAGWAMMLEDIGFYTLSNFRAAQASELSPLWRCELLLTGRCNFRCPYCRRVGGDDLSLYEAMDIVTLWAKQGLKNIRFSGGEPTLWTHLASLVSYARANGIRRVAISTNGSAQKALYRELLNRGVNDFSVSLDACCAQDGDRIAHGQPGDWGRVVDNIRYLASNTYTTVGVVFTEENEFTASDIVRFASSLGVHDVRVIPAAQRGVRLPILPVSADLLAKHPILRYRYHNLLTGHAVRGLSEGDPARCPLVLDDMAVMGRNHYPCIIYLREGGEPIGEVGSNMRRERTLWFEHHNCLQDPICASNCLDVCRDYNATWEAARQRPY